MHAHRCGHVWKEPKTSALLYLALLGEPIEEEGCGHVWEHEDSEHFNKEAHVCPSCGRGPWVIKYNEQSCKLLGTRYEHAKTEESVRYQEGQR